MTRCVVVTGSSSGIGQSLSEMLLAQGDTVIGLARDHSKYVPDTTRYVPKKVDLTVSHEVQATFESIISEYPQVCTVVSNAGAGAIGSLEEFSLEQIDAAMQVNLMSHLYVARCILPRFKKMSKGDLILVGSEASLRGAARGSLYCAAKFGMKGMIESLRQECARNSVRVMGVYPGMVRTPFFDELSFEPGPQPENAIGPEDVARVVCTMLEMPRSTVIDGVEMTPLKKVVAKKS